MKFREGEAYVVYEGTDHRMPGETGWFVVPRGGIVTCVGERVDTSPDGKRQTRYYRFFAFGALTTRWYRPKKRIGKILREAF